MKVGILTFHTALNYGAVLQAYALQREITLKGAECEIVDYRCKEIDKVYSVFYMNDNTIKSFISMIVHLPIKIIKYNKFKSFRKKYIKCSSNIYRTNNRNELSRMYDVIIVGSDQVWNTALTGEDTTYFMEGISDKTIKASYAASLGGELSDSAKKIAEKELGKFSFVSVREMNSIEIIKGYTNKHIQCVCDPVFFMNRQDWLRDFNIKEAQNGSYILAYCLHERTIYQCGENMAVLYNKKLRVVPDGLLLTIKGRKYHTLGVKKLIEQINGADCIITDSFHILAMSLILHKNVRVMLKRKQKQLNGRLNALLELLELSEIIISSEEINQPRIIDIDYLSVDEKLRQLKESSDEYIANILRCKG